MLTDSTLILVLINCCEYTTQSMLADKENSMEAQNIIQGKPKASSESKKQSVHIEFLIHIADMKLLNISGTDDSCLRNNYRITIRRQHNKFKTDALPFVCDNLPINKVQASMRSEKTRNQEPTTATASFNQTFLLASTMHCVGEIPKEKYAVLTVQHVAMTSDKSNDEPSKPEETQLDTDIYLPLHEYYTNLHNLDSLDVSYPFNAEYHNFRLNLRVTMNRVTQPVNNSAALTQPVKESVAMMNSEGQLNTSDSVKTEYGDESLSSSGDSFPSKVLKGDGGEALKDVAQPSTEELVFEKEIVDKKMEVEKKEKEQLEKFVNELSAKKGSKSIRFKDSEDDAITESRSIQSSYAPISILKVTSQPDLSENATTDSSGEKTEMVDNNFDPNKKIYLEDVEVALRKYKSERIIVKHEEEEAIATSDETIPPSPLKTKIEGEESSESSHLSSHRVLFGAAALFLFVLVALSRNIPQQSISYPRKLLPALAPPISYPMTSDSNVLVIEEASESPSSESLEDEAWDSNVADEGNVVENSIPQSHVPVISEDSHDLILRSSDNLQARSVVVSESYAPENNAKALVSEEESKRHAKNFMKSILRFLNVFNPFHWMSILLGRKK